jgi:hypothetical protein
MSALHQPLSEIRKWNYKYFMDVYIDLQICVREKEYSRYRRSDKPDKANFRKEFKNNFS